VIKILYSISLADFNGRIEITGAKEEIKIIEQEKCTLQL